MAKGGKIALLLGLVTGAATGLLFAPEKGKSLRKKIVSERKKGGLGTKAVGNDLKKMGEEIFGLMKEIAELEEVQTAWNKTKGTVADMADMKKDEIDKLVDKAHTKAEEMKSMVASYAGTKKKEIEAEVKKKAKKVETKVKGKAKKAVKKAKSKAKKIVKKVEKKVTPKKKKTTKKKK